MLKLVAKPLFLARFLLPAEVWRGTEHVVILRNKPVGEAGMNLNIGDDRWR